MLESSVKAVRFSVVALAVASWAATLCAQLGAPPRGGPSGGGSLLERLASWKCDVLHMKSGGVYRGAILERTDDEIKFVNIARPRGKRMNLVLISFDAQSVESIELLTPSERKALCQQIQPLLASKSMSVIEAGRMEDITLTQEERGGRPWFLYQNPWFQLESSADEESTRRCAVRVEQILRAFRQVLPPRTEGRGALRVVLFGSMDEYRRHVEALGLRIDNPAYYSTAENMIVAGSDLVRYRERLQAIRLENNRLKERLQQADRDRNRRLVETAARLQAAGIAREKIDEELRIRKAAWDREYRALLGQAGDGGDIAEINRRNEQVFQSVTEQMFRRLYHEAFHAYLENYVFPAPDHHVPRWLNEGLAQVFECGQLDADTLRIDAPNEKALNLLRRDLQSRHPLRLAQVLSADDRAFLVTHGDAQASDLYYAYSWGLAWYLTFERDLLDDDKLEQYVTARQTQNRPVSNFEHLVGLPLDQFESLWREAMFDPQLTGPKAGRR